MSSRRVARIVVGNLVVIGMAVWGAELVWVRADASGPSKVVPDAQVIAAKMEEQMSSAVQIRFRWKNHEDPDGEMTNTYIRAGGMQYLTSIYKDKVLWDYFVKDDKILKSLRYDNEPQEYLGLADTKKAGSRLGGIDLPDPLRYNLPMMGDLVDVIGRGSVASVMESVDGADCWRIDILPEAESAKGLAVKVWVDPALGFLPRMIRSSNPNAETSVAKLSQYKELAAGIWYPMHIEWTVESWAGSQTITAGIESGNVIDKSTISVDTKFPSGIKVEDHVMNAEYIAP